MITFIHIHTNSFIRLKSFFFSTFSSATSTPDKTFLGDTSVTHSAHPFPDKAVGLQGSTPFTVVDSGVLSGHGIDDLTPSLDFSHSGLDIGQFLNLDS